MRLDIVIDIEVRFAACFGDVDVPAVVVHAVHREVADGVVIGDIEVAGEIVGALKHGNIGVGEVNAGLRIEDECLDACTDLTAELIDGAIAI